MNVSLGVLSWLSTTWGDTLPGPVSCRNPKCAAQVVGKRCDMDSALHRRPGLEQAEMEWTGMTGNCGHSGGPVILCLSSDCQECGEFIPQHCILGRPRCLSSDGLQVQKWLVYTAFQFTNTRFPSAIRVHGESKYLVLRGKVSDLDWDSLGFIPIGQWEDEGSEFTAMLSFVAFCLF